MNSSLEHAASMAQTLQKSNFAPSKVQVVIAPPFPYITVLQKALSSTKVEVAAQNCYFKDSGAFTGEVSPVMLKDLSVPWVILGHSERRTLFKEGDELIADKTVAALKHGRKVILCVGETLDERKADQTKAVVIRQLDAVFQKVHTQWEDIVIAYEPVWAIGTGVVATPDQAQEVHKVIREWSHGKMDSDQLRIIYGGSVDAKNCGELSLQKDIDGFLVGGASLKPDFLTVIDSLSNKK